MADINVKTQLIDREDIFRFVPAANFRLVKFFENLASDVSETIPNAIGTSIAGPSVATDNDLVIFDGTTGKKVKDSGVNIVDVALLASPHFTGVPTAPTAAPGTNTTQLATTAYVQGEVAAGVDGPAVATNNAVALFDGTTGKLIKDSGVLLTSLAPLASPALTGNPTAPNQSAGDNDTSIANTAFVQNAVTTLSTAAAAFSAHNNGTSQVIPSGAFTVVTLGTEVYDVGSKFASNAWTPPANRPVSIVGSISLNLAAAGLMTVSVFKNGAEYKRGVHLPPATVGFAAVTVTCQDIPNGTDVYDLRVFQQTGANQSTTGTSNLVYFQGCTVGS